MTIYKKQRTKPYKADDSKEELRARLKRQAARIAALESHINHKFLTIRKGLQDFEKSDAYNPEKHKDRVFLWCIVEELQIVTTSKPIVGGGNVDSMIYFDGDEERPAKLYSDIEEAEKDGDFKENELTPVFRVRYFNAANVFLTRAAASEHLKTHKDRYTNPKIVAMFPVENPEFEEVFRHFKFLGENIPGALSVWEEREQMNDIKHHAAQQAKKIKTQEETIADYAKEISRLEKENEKILDIITVKKGKK